MPATIAMTWPDACVAFTALVCVTILIIFVRLMNDEEYEIDEEWEEEEDDAK